MTGKLNLTAKQIANEVIALSATLDYKMEKWSDVSSRPYDLSETECVGFINKESATAGLNLVVDIQASKGQKRSNSASLGDQEQARREPD